MKATTCLFLLYGAWTGGVVQAFSTKPSKTTNAVADGWKTAASSFGAAAFIGIAAGTFSLPEPSLAAAPVELSRGAVVVKVTTTTSGNTDVISTPRVDGQKLLQSFLQGRKELAASVGRVQSVIQEELQLPIWKKVIEQVVQVEGDLAPSIQVLPPADLRQTIQDLTQGKINLVVNGEIINVAVQPRFSQEEDDLIIKVTGFKGEALPDLASPSTIIRRGPIASYLAKFDRFWTFWNTPLDLGGVDTTKGQVLLGGAGTTIFCMYGFSYAYYTEQLEQEARAAEEKKKAVQQKKKEAAAAAKKAATDAEKKEIKVVKEEAPATSEPEPAEASQPTTTPRRRRRLRFWLKDY